MTLLKNLRDVSDRLRQTAAEVDQSSSPPKQQLTLLANSGYFSEICRASAPQRRRTLDLLSSACGATAFLASQQEGACRRLLEAEHPLFEQASRGQQWVGVCFAHLRREPSPVQVETEGDTLRFDGLGPWFSGFGLMEKVVLAGATSQGEFLTALADLSTPGIKPGTAARLAVMNATTTVPLHLQRVTLPLNDLLARGDAKSMNRADMHSTVLQSSRSLGVARAAAQHLPDTANAQLLGHIERQHEKMDSWDIKPDWSQATSLRQEALELAALAIQTALVTVGGRAHSLEHPLQRLVREAAFYATTQLTVELRQAYLDKL